MKQEKKKHDFDTISHKFIFDTLSFLNFGNFFIKAVKTLNINNNSSVKLT